VSKLSLRSNCGNIYNLPEASVKWLLANC